MNFISQGGINSMKKNIIFLSVLALFAQVVTPPPQL